MQVEWFGYKLRDRVSAEFLSGKGIEIGAGSRPHQLPEGASALYFDKRDDAGLRAQFKTDIGYTVQDVSQIPQEFPNGADFLIAHQVLEHIHDHISALAEWHGHVKDGGVVVLSVPDKRGLIYDKMRPSTSFSHILQDYALGRKFTDFEAREHIASFCLGWSSAWHYLDRDQFASRALDHTARDDNDVHWHANDRDTWTKVITAALLASRCGADFLRIIDMESEPPFTTQGDVIFIYRLNKSQAAVINGLPSLRDELTEEAARLRAAAERLESLAKGRRKSVLSRLSWR
jgi:SAM-dependent methyltransferase